MFTIVLMQHLWSRLAGPKLAALHSVESDLKPIWDQLVLDKYKTARIFVPAFYVAWTEPRRERQLLPFFLKPKVTWPRPFDEFFVWWATWPPLWTRPPRGPKGPRHLPAVWTDSQRPQMKAKLKEVSSEMPILHNMSSLTSVVPFITLQLALWQR